jgi:hypothetical protein
MDTIASVKYWLCEDGEGIRWFTASGKRQQSIADQIANFTGYSQQRVSELLQRLEPKPRAVTEQAPEKQDSTPTSIDGILDSNIADKETQSMTLAEISGVLDEVENGLLPTTIPPLTKQVPPKPVEPKSEHAAVQALLLNRKGVIYKDLKDRVPSAQRRVYIDGLTRILAEMGG